MTAPSELPGRSPRVPSLFADLACIGTGLVVLLAAGLVYSAGSGLPVVDPRDMDIAPDIDDSPGSPGVAALVVAVAMIACAGLPRRGKDDDAFRGGVGQVLGSVGLLMALFVAWHLTSIWYYGPEAPCLYDGCWPAAVQSFGLVGPGLVAVVALAVAGLLAGRVRRLTRTIVPAALWLGAVLVQRVGWEPWLLPLLLYPPPA